MIGIKYVNGNNRIMEDRINANDRESVALECNLVDPMSSSRKPSLLRNQILRRTTTRTRKRSPTGVAIANLANTDAPVSVSVVSDSDTRSQRSSENDAVPWDETKPTTLQTVGDKDSNGVSKSIQLQQLHRHDTELELKNGNKIQADDGSSKGSSFDISLIDSDEDDSNVKVESKRPATPGKPLKPKAVTTAAIATTSNLSILVKGNDIVIEHRDDYRDDNRSGLSERKESSPQSSNSKQRPVQSCPKGIMKRPRDSHVTYHHPRRPLPPPLPPPGYKEIPSPMSCGTLTSSDSGFSPAERRRPFRKRVSFNEEELVEQYKMSKLRRKARYEKRRSFSGILSMAMPVIMPYFMAILILVASSMVPLPTDQGRAQKPLSMPPEIVIRAPIAPTPQPIFIDIGSRMWDERKRAKEATKSLETVAEFNNNQDTNSVVSSRL